jgi:CheY-like chemotaxis protein
MSLSFEILHPQDRPALLALTSEECLGFCQSTLEELGYKVHAAANQGDFITRFTRVQYPLVLLDEMFDSTGPQQNLTLQYLQLLPMTQRRHATILLLGNTVATLDNLQAFQHSVHAVLNLVDIGSLAPIVQRVTSDNELFLKTYTEVQSSVAQSRA